MASSPPDEIGDTQPVCINCVLDLHLELGLALDHAREYGEWLSAERSGPPAYLSGKHG